MRGYRLEKLIADEGVITDVDDLRMCQEAFDLDYSEWPRIYKMMDEAKEMVTRKVLNHMMGIFIRIEEYHAGLD